MCQSLDALYFCSEFFKLNCDKPPNRSDTTCELPGSLYTKKIVYNIYLKYCERHTANEFTPISLKSFYRMWTRVFPNVKVRKFLAVNGKCDKCLEMRRIEDGFTSIEQFKKLKAMKHYHRVFVMKQKLAYYKNRLLAQDNKEEIMSIIFDGASLDHNKLPHNADQKEPNHTAKQHLLGYKDHGEEQGIAVSLPNVKTGTNLAVTVLLKQIHKRQQKAKADGTYFPHTLIIQTDGGSENTSLVFFAICETLVQHDVFKTIIINRLPVGHTHEDIDAMFGTIWTKIKNMNIRSPAEYDDAVMSAFDEYYNTKFTK